MLIIIANSNGAGNVYICSLKVANYCKLTYMHVNVLDIEFTETLFTFQLIE